MDYAGILPGFLIKKVGHILKNYRMYFWDPSRGFVSVVMNALMIILDCIKGIKFHLLRERAPKAKPFHYFKFI